MLDTVFSFFSTSSDGFGGGADGDAKAFLYDNSVSRRCASTDLLEGHYGYCPTIDHTRVNEVGPADLSSTELTEAHPHHAIHAAQVDGLQNEFDLPFDANYYFEKDVIGWDEQLIFSESINNTVNIDQSSYLQASNCNGNRDGVVEAGGLEAPDDKIVLDLADHFAELGIWNESYTHLISGNPTYSDNYSMDQFGYNTDRFMISAEDIVKMAGLQYIHGVSPLHTFPIRANHNHHMIFPGTLCKEEESGVETGHLLFASAERIGNAQHDGAVPLLLRCRELSSPFGNPLQRLAYYFTEALLERVQRETGEAKSKAMNGVIIGRDIDSHKEAELALLAFHRALPYGQVMHFTAIQAILDAVRNAKRIHVIDLGIRCGLQWTILIQSLNQLCTSFSWPRLALVKITAVGANREKLKRTGKRLKEFAKSLNVPFSYKILVISNVEDLREGLSQVIEDGEAIAVNASGIMGGLLHDPIPLQHLVRIIKDTIRPHILIIIEMEANNNSPSFVNRFIEALFYYSAVFDSLEATLDRSSTDRFRIEYVFGVGIRNMIAQEGKDRIIRHVGMEVWRSFLRQSGFKESRLSHRAWYQASLLLEQFHLHNSHAFTLSPNGFALMVGWKETPFCALSAWTCRD